MGNNKITNDNSIFDEFGVKPKDRYNFWQKILNALKNRTYSKDLKDVKKEGENGDAVDGAETEVKNTLFDIINTYCDFPYKSGSEEYSELFDSLYQDAETRSEFWNRSVDELIKDFKKNYGDLSDELEIGIGLKLIDLKKSDAGFDFNKSPFIWPNTNIQGQTYDEVRKDQILESLQNQINLQFTKEKYQGTEAKISNSTEKNKWIRLLMPQYARRIDIEDLNRNFWVIGQVLSAISAWLFGDKSPINSTIKSLINEVAQLWENVLYLWLELALLSQKISHDVRVIVTYIPSHEFADYREFNDFELEKHITDVSEVAIPDFQDHVEDIKQKISYLIEKYPFENLCVIPVIRWHNYRHNYYSTEIYTGLYLHASQDEDWQFIKFQESGSSRLVLDNYPDLNNSGDIDIDDAQMVLEAYNSLMVHDMVYDKKTGKANYSLNNPEDRKKAREYTGLTDRQLQLADVYQTGYILIDDAQIVLQFYNDTHVTELFPDNKSTWIQFFSYEVGKDPMFKSGDAYTGDSLIITLEDQYAKRDSGYLKDYVYGLREVEDGYEYVSPLSSVEKILEKDQKAFYGALRVIPKIDITYNNGFRWTKVAFEVYDAVADTMLKKKNPEPLYTYYMPVSVPYPDLNKTGKIEIDDATMILQAYNNVMTGLPHGLSDEDFKLADVNQNGVIGIDDAETVLEYYNECYVSGTIPNDTPEAWQVFLFEKFPALKKKYEISSDRILFFKTEPKFSQDVRNRAFKSYVELMGYNPPYLGELPSWWCKTRKIPDLEPVGPVDQMTGYLIKVGDFLPKIFRSECYRWLRLQKTSAGIESDYLLNYTPHLPKNTDTPIILDVLQTDGDKLNEDMYNEIVTKLKGENDKPKLKIREISEEVFGSEDSKYTDLILDINWGVKRLTKEITQVKEEKATYPLRIPSNFYDIIKAIRNLGLQQDWKVGPDSWDSKKAKTRIDAYIKLGSKEGSKNSIAQIYEGETGFWSNFDQVDTINLGWAYNHPEKTPNGEQWPTSFPLYNFFADIYSDGAYNWSTYPASDPNKPNNFNNINEKTALFLYKKDSNNNICFQEALSWTKEILHKNEQRITQNDFIEAGYLSIEYYLASQYTYIAVDEETGSSAKINKSGNVSNIMYFITAIGTHPWCNDVSANDKPQGTQGYWSNCVLLHMFRFISNEYQKYINQKYEGRTIYNFQGVAIGTLQYVGQINRQETFFKRPHQKVGEYTFTRKDGGRWRLPVLFPYTESNEVYIFKDKETQLLYYFKYGQLKKDHPHDPLLEQFHSNQQGFLDHLKQHFDEYYQNGTTLEHGYLVSEEDIIKEDLNVDISGLWTVFDGNTSTQKKEKVSLIDTEVKNTDLPCYESATGQKDPTMKLIGATGFYFIESEHENKLAFSNGSASIKYKENQQPTIWTFKGASEEYKENLSYTAYNLQEDGVTGDSIMLPIKKYEPSHVNDDGATVVYDENYIYYYKQNQWR